MLYELTMLFILRSSATEFPTDPTLAVESEGGGGGREGDFSDRTVERRLGDPVDTAEGSSGVTSSSYKELAFEATDIFLSCSEKSRLGRGERGIGIIDSSIWLISLGGSGRTLRGAGFDNSRAITSCSSKGDEVIVDGLIESSSVTLLSAVGRDNCSAGLGLSLLLDVCPMVSPSSESSIVVTDGVTMLVIEGLSGKSSASALLPMDLKYSDSRGSVSVGGSSTIETSGGPPTACVLTGVCRSGDWIGLGAWLEVNEMLIF